MTKLRRSVAPAYLFLCLVLGGSPQGIWTNAFLQLLAVALVAWAFIERREESLSKPARQLLILAAIAIGLVAIQLVPLPASAWTALPGREMVVDGFAVLGMAPPAMPMSLAPYETVATLLAFLPALGMLAATVGLRAYAASWLAGALIAGSAAGVLLGILQATSPIPEQSPWYFYKISNFGVATGFFANSNHMASLLLVTIPFIAAAGARLRERSSDVRMRTAGLALAFSGIVAIVLGLLLNKSLAGYGLGVPVLLVSLLILFGTAARLARAGLVVVGVASIAAVALLWTRPVGTNFDRLGATASVTSRHEIAGNSWALATEFAPIGTGLGSFAAAYPLKENPAVVDRYFVNHAHNDYLELAVELGLPGIILMALFLVWWARAVLQMLRSPASDQYALAGAIASAAILLHSAVDYPLRSSAMMAVMAMCLALLIQSRRSARSEKDLRPTRHIRIG